MHDLVEDGLEVVEEDGIGCAFEDQGQSPVRVDAVILGGDLGSNESVCEEEDDGEGHAQQHDTEAGTGLDELAKSEVVVLFDDDAELDGGEDPPGVSERGLDDPSGDEDVRTAEMVEVGVVGPHV